MPQNHYLQNQDNIRKARNIGEQPRNATCKTINTLDESQTKTVTMLNHSPNQINHCIYNGSYNTTAKNYGYGVHLEFP